MFYCLTALCLGCVANLFTKYTCTQHPFCFVMHRNNEVWQLNVPLAKSQCLKSSFVIIGISHYGSKTQCHSMLNKQLRSESPELWKSINTLPRDGLACKIDHKSFCLFSVCHLWSDAESGRSIMSISMQYAVYGSGWAWIKSYFVYLWKCPPCLWLGTVRLVTNWHKLPTFLWAFGAPEDPDRPTKRCCRDPRFQWRLRFTRDKEVINEIYFLFNYSAQPHSPDSSPLFRTNSPELSSESNIFPPLTHQTKRALDNDAPPEETHGILSV